MNNKYLYKEPSQGLRRFQHRRIQTEIEDPNNKCTRNGYYKLPDKEYSKPKFIEAYTKQNTKELQKKTFKMGNKNKLLFTKHLQTEPNEEVTDSQRAQ